MASSTGSNRSHKRARAVEHDQPDPDELRSAITSLIERLSQVSERARDARAQHVSNIEKIDEKISDKQTALRAAASVVVPPPNEEFAAFQHGIRVSSSRKRPSNVGKVVVPAIQMLMENEPPEKVIHENSIITRAHAINRKNAEMAKERLPKQPEAQRNKTHWDYVLEEAAWLSSDFREERKWKLFMARKLARAAVAYIARQEAEKQKAIKDEITRMRRIANGIARDVRKFWSQIREISHLRTKEIVNIRLKEQRNQQLQEVLQEAGQLASALSLDVSTVDNETPGLAQPSSIDHKPIRNPSDPNGDDVSADESDDSDEGDTNRVDAMDDSDDFEGELDDEMDDETTMEVAEAESASDPLETSKLEAEASVPIEELLRSRGIDPNSFPEKKPSEPPDRVEPQTPQPTATKTGPVAVANGIKSCADRTGLEKTVPRISSHIVGKSSSLPPSNGTTVVQVSGSVSNLGAKVPSATALELQANGKIPPQRAPAAPSTSNEATGAFVHPSRLLRGTLRDYQTAGVKWLVALHKNKVNGILADEMGLGKTIQTISLLAWLALEKGIWGPHLIVVPTSLMVNWEVEFKKWLPAFKILTYFGSQKERKAKRVGWTRPNQFHVCITSYALVVQDAAALKRKEWVYLILDEAHNIKNFQSQRWQTLLHFPSAHRLLLTGTPLQNNIMELWSLLHFLRPKLFESQTQFKELFSKPLEGLISEDSIKDPDKRVAELHGLLRPFLLRRLKRDVEKSLRPKVEHILKCTLSKRQRQLYEDFLSRGDTQNTLERGDFFGVMGVLMQLRKVCNHPDLFEGRPILSPFSMKPLFYAIPAPIMGVREVSPFNRLDLSLLSLDMATEELNGWPGEWHTSELLRISAASLIDPKPQCTVPTSADVITSGAALEAARRKSDFQKSILRHHARLTSFKVRRRALFGRDKIAAASILPKRLLRYDGLGWENVSCCPNLVTPLEVVVSRSTPVIERFVCCIRKVNAPTVEIRFAGDDSYRMKMRSTHADLSMKCSPLTTLFRPSHIRSSVTLPDTRLIQWDCGKLQTLSRLLRTLKSKGSRVLIYSQMSKVLDVLESFLNLHAIRYLRLDGQTKTGDRQRLVERFNTDSRIFCMILTTRAGGVGLNLTGADTVIFYDTDYNPAIDAQAQDRVHRIGQKKTVHIYRLVSEKTVEENILRRANEKRTLESIVISQAGFDIDSIRKRTGLEDLIRMPRPNGRIQSPNVSPNPNAVHGSSTALSQKAASSFQEQLKPVPILTSYGSVRPLAWVEREERHKKMVNCQDPGKAGDPLQSLAEESDVYNALLAKDEGSTEKMNNDEISNEFADPEVPSEAPKKSKTPARTFAKIESSLNPIQRLALKFVEQGVEELASLSKKAPDEEELVLPLEEKIESEPQNLGTNGTCSTVPDEIEPDEDIVFYEQATSPNAYLSSLKALTDTDANIKLYLPLRDGGPEELKISTVVNGTAAAGLECAEDAAFFPHAYNRMSRTIHATKRQKEKAAYNLRRREEIEAKKLQDKRVAAVKRAAAEIQLRTSNSDTHTRVGTTRGRDDSNANLPPPKRLRTENGAVAMGSIEGVFPNMNGLFKKNVKRNQRRVSSKYSKSSLSAGNSTVQMGEGIGKNDGWTIEEDRALINLMPKYQGNMAYVVDILASQTAVSAGNRRKRSIKQCCDRWFNCILKENKNGQAASTSNIPDSDVLKQNLSYFVSSAMKSEKVFRTFDSKSTAGAEEHKSHTRVIMEAKKLVPSKIEPSFPLTFGQKDGKIAVSTGHSSGFKPHECTPHALQKKKSPFMRPIANARLPFHTREQHEASFVNRFPHSSAALQVPPVRPTSRSQPGPSTAGPSRLQNGKTPQSYLKQPASTASMIQQQQKTLNAQNVQKMSTDRPVAPPAIAAVQQQQYANAAALKTAQQTAAVNRNLTAARRPPVPIRPPTVNRPPGMVGGPAVATAKTSHLAYAPAAPPSVKAVANQAGGQRRYTAPNVRNNGTKVPNQLQNKNMVNHTVARAQKVIPQVAGMQPTVQKAAATRTVGGQKGVATGQIRLSVVNNKANINSNKVAGGGAVAMNGTVVAPKRVAASNAVEQKGKVATKVTGNANQAMFRSTAAVVNTGGPLVGGSATQKKVAAPVVVISQGVQGKVTRVVTASAAPGVELESKVSGVPAVRKENGTEQEKVSVTNTILADKKTKE